MRVVHLHHGRQYYYDSEFSAVNNDRVDNNITLEFFTTECDCGACGLYLVETASTMHAFRNLKEDIPQPYLETIDVECPAQCGGQVRMAFPDVHPVHGLKIRCLEAWTRRVEVQGLDEPEYQKPERIPQGAVRATMETRKSPTFTGDKECYIRFTINPISSAIRTPQMLEQEMIHKATHLIHNLLVNKP